MIDPHVRRRRPAWCARLAWLACVACVGGSTDAWARGPSRRSPDPAASVPVTIRWHDGGRVKRLVAAWRAEDERLLLSERTAPDGELRRELLSVIGPMVATRWRQMDQAQDAPRPVASERIEVRVSRGTALDLEAFLAQTAQTRAVVQQWLQQAPDIELDRARCPEPAAMAPGHTLTWWIGFLRGNGCLRDTARGLADAGGPRGFAIADWWPEQDRVTLLVEGAPVQIQPAIMELSVFRATVRPPPEWRRWLDAARAGDGLLADHRRWRAAGLRRPADIEAGQRWWRSLRGHGGEALIGQLVAPLRPHQAGVDNEVHGQAAFRVRKVLRSDPQGAMFRGTQGSASGPPLRLDVVSAAELQARAVERPDARRLCRLRRDLCRRGRLFLLLTATVVEQQWEAAAIAVTPRQATRLQQVLGTASSAK